jgi:peptide methionine sulfoxide reductase MsrA
METAILKLFESFLIQQRFPNEKIVQLFFDNPRVPEIYGDQDVQYQIACWAVDDRQMTLAKNAAESAGKGGVPVYDFRCTSWYDGEESHQNFFGSIKLDGRVY